MFSICFRPKFQPPHKKTNYHAVTQVTGPSIPVLSCPVLSIMSCLCDVFLGCQRWIHWFKRKVGFLEFVICMYLPQFLCGRSQKHTYLRYLCKHVTLREGKKNLLYISFLYVNLGAVLAFYFAGILFKVR